MLNPEIMEQRLSILTDPQIALFEKAIQKPFTPKEDELDDAYFLNEMDYGIVTFDNSLVVPNDVKAVYGSINTPAFHEYRKQTSWLMKCLDVQNAFYGKAPIDVIYEMYQNRPKYKIGKKSMIELFHKIPDDLKDCYLAEDSIMHVRYRKDKELKALMNMQLDKEFYVPTYREVEDYGKHLYLSKEDAYEQLRAFFVKNAKMSFEMAEDCTYEIWHMVDIGDGMGDIIDWLTGKRGLAFHSEQELGLFVKLIQEANNNTRILANRGFKPNEISNHKENLAKGIYPTIVPGSGYTAKLLEESLPKIAAMGFKVDIDGGADVMPVINYPDGIKGEAILSSKKIYPNDPCPCGSGKKYKKCCGRL
jgi:hypothetical protein